ncbi:plasmid pRiA4b ORF-3 family protein [Pseudomonas fluorescens]|uniref:plasmid pRiA4b ORF-3 family protein n=1 Tax=Pseudomonas fluorescens TaxID=294 RepID=UPI001F085A5D|nr:plasmid pRiA4b ORF-3 family protein [Pseudomonas fluorescens]
MAVPLSKGRYVVTPPILYTLHIQLEQMQLNSSIWRRIRVSGDCTLGELLC